MVDYHLLNLLCVQDYRSIHPAKMAFGCVEDEYINVDKIEDDFAEDSGVCDMTYNSLGCCSLSDLQSPSSTLNSRVQEEKRLLINSRERQRMHDLNSALDSLKKVLPYSNGPSVKKLSKLSTMLLARNYIVVLTKSLEEMKKIVNDLSTTCTAHTLRADTASRIPDLHPYPTDNTVHTLRADTASKTPALHSYTNISTAAISENKLSPSRLRYSPYMLPRDHRRFVPLMTSSPYRQENPTSLTDTTNAKFERTHSDKGHLKFSIESLLENQQKEERLSNSSVCNLPHMYTTSTEQSSYRYPENYISKIQPQYSGLMKAGLDYVTKEF